MFSLIDKHTLCPVAIDRDHVTLSMQKITELAILSCNTPAEATDYIINSGEELFGLEPDKLATNLRNEAKPHQLGLLHWTRHFGPVKDEIGQRPLTYVVSDVRDIFLAHALTLTAAETGPIHFFNLTNVHNHITGQTMDFLTHMPISSEAVVLFSDWRGMQHSLSKQDVSLKRHVGDISTYLTFSRFAMLDQ